jgi:hypothetical protein
MGRIYVNNAGGVITDAPLTAGATSIESTAFADLPAVASPDYIVLILDWDQADGIPEIVYVTAHTAAAETVTVTRGRETSTGGSTAREHLADTKWVAGITAADCKRHEGSPGDTKWGIWSSAPEGWLLFGATYTTADVLYPDLWAVAPAAYKSGTSLVLQSVDGRAIMGGGTLGATGGANTHTLITANLPAHAHAVTHNHAAFDSAPGGVAHTHAIDHNHAATTSDPGGVAHTHAINHDHANQNFTVSVSTQTAVRDSSTAGTTDSFMSASGTGSSQVNTVNPDVEASVNVNLDSFTGTSGAASATAHTHGVDIPDFTGTSGAASATAHVHSVDIPEFVGNSGSVGSGTAVDHTPANIRMNLAVKT